MFNLKQKSRLVNNIVQSDVYQTIVFKNSLSDIKGKSIHLLNCVVEISEIE